MAAKPIKYKPTGKVTSLAAPKRTGNSYKMSWVVPDGEKNDQNESRPDECYCWLNFDSNKGRKNLIESSAAKGTTTDNAVKALMKGYDAVWYRRGDHWLKTSKEDTYQAQTINRQLYHPFVKGKYLLKVWGDVYLKNGFGTAPCARSGSFELKPPREPKIAAPSLAASTQRLTAKITTDAGADARERYDTMYCITRKDNFKAAYKKAAIVTKKNNKASWIDTTATEVTPGYDAGEALKLSLGQWMEITIKAYARGIRGNSKTVTRQHVFCHPSTATVGRKAKNGRNAKGEQLYKYVIDNDTNKDGSINTQGLVHIPVVTNSKAHRLVDKCVLQRLKDTQATTATEAQASEGWEDVDGQVDNANCTGFTDAIADAITLKEGGQWTGNRTWYRVATYHDNMPPQYSKPVQAEGLYHPAPNAADDKVTITSVTSGADGTSLLVAMSWRNDDSTATEVSWSVDEDAWESTVQPETYDVTWGKGGSTKTASLTIKNLAEGVPVHIRARRHNDDGVFGSYSDTAKAIPMSTPESVTLSLPESVARGRDLQCAWTFDGNEQTAFAIERLEGADWKGIAEGSGPNAACIIPGSALDGFDAMFLRVGVTTGGGWGYSEQAAVRVIDAPEVEVSIPATLAAQPAAFDVRSDTAAARLVAKVHAAGISYETPSGTSQQVPGDCVWSDVVDPEWEQYSYTEVVDYEFSATEDTSVDPTKTYYVYDEDGESYSEASPEAGDNPSSEGWYEMAPITREVADGYIATIELPPALPFRDGGAYTLTVQGLDQASGLPGEPDEVSFEVAWAHQATAPTGTVEVDAANRMCDVVPAAPTGAAASDLCDIYRVTPDGAYLIAEGIQFGGTVRDRFAPFGDVESSYRLCTRTADGDLAWADVPYDMPVDVLRLDWGQRNHVELPYNISIGDSREKDFEERQHLDGTRAGYWNPGAGRKASLSAVLVQVESAADAALLNDMGSHAGAVFVRTPTGSAYQANVDLKGLDSAYSSGLTSVSLSAAEIMLTDEFRVLDGDYIEPGSSWDDEYEEEA